MLKRISANIGFLLQITGLLVLLPIVVGFYFGETQELVPLFISCVGFLGCGFLMNSLCERRDLDFKSSNVLFVVAFLILPLIGALPFIYNDPFGSANFADRVTNGIFESVSGFTTTGFSFVANPEVLPNSLLIYRSLIELIGGVGIVFLLLVFFQSKKSLEDFGHVIGVDNLSNMKRTFASVLAIYSIFIVAFIVVFFFLGFRNLVQTGTIVIDTLTGGFQPPAPVFQQYLSLAPKICLMLLMLIGSVNFAFNYYLFKGKITQAFSKEVILYLAIIAFAAIAVSSLGQIGAIDSIFHVISMSSSTGQDYIGVATQNSTVLSIFILLMLVGGCAFSMAGGIRISRLLTLAKTVKENITGLLVKEQAISPAIPSTEEQNPEDNLALAAVVLFAATLFVFAIIFTTIGVSFTDALFEVGSALTTNGISMGATTVAMPLAYKWLMISAMTIGRIEIMTIFIALFPLRKN